MAATAEAQQGEGVAVGKKMLCESIGWSRMKLDRRLEADPAFPVVSRGTQAGGWSFDVDAVRAYLDPEEDREIAAEDLATPEGREARAELTARQRRDLAQAQLHEDKLRRQRAELVEVAELKMVLSEGVAKMGVSLNKLADTLVRRLNLPEAARPIIQQEVDEARRHLVTSLRALKSDA